MNIFQRVKLWWDLRQAVKEFDKEVDENINMYYHRDTTSEIQDDQDVQQKYYNGLTLMKRRLNAARNGTDGDTYLKKYYTEGKLDLLALAESDSHSKKQLSEGLKQAFVYQGADVKTAQDEAKMIDKRIGDYIKLQKSVEERTLLRSIREAYKRGDEAIYSDLMKEWNIKYGKSRNH